MNKLLHSIREFVLLLENGIKRFYIAAFFTLIVFGISCFLIYGDNITDDIEKILIRISFVSFLGIFISILTVLFKEKLNSNTKVYNITSAILSFAIPILYFFFILTDVENKYQMATIFGIFIAFMLIIVYFSNKTSNEKFSTHFSYLVKTLFTSSIISFLVMLGLFLCTSAVYFLIYEFNEPYKIYFIIASFCWLVLFINLFLAMLPKDERDYKIPKFFKIITLYTALPIYTVLILILYIYLGKILITRNFPSGQLNWFASFASLIGIFLFVTLKQYYDKNTFVKWYIKIFGYALLPIIAMQCTAYYIRFSNYGLTTARYISAVLIGISIITAIVSLIKNGKYIPYILLLTAACSIITTTGFFNLFDIPIYEQNARLTSLLKEQSMLDEDNKIIANPDIDKQTKIKITSAYNYIAKENIEKSSLLKNYDGIGFNQVFGFDQEYESRGHYHREYFSYSLKQQEISISGYSSLINIARNSEVNDNILKVKYDNQEYIFDLNNFIKDLNNEYGKTESELPQEKLTIEQGDIKLIIMRIGFSLDMNSADIKIENIDGYILKR